MRRIAAALSLVAWLYAGPQTPLAQDQEADVPYRIAADVDLVVLEVAVFDRRGFTRGLGKENFELYENGRRQPITLFRQEDAPVSVGLLVDSSTSMRSKREETAAAALAFVAESHPDDEVFLVHFNDTPRFGLPPSVPFTGDRVALAEALTAAPAVGRTALYDAIAAGLEHLKLGRRPRKALLVFSDGGDNQSRHSLDQILNVLEQSGVTLYAIGLFETLDRDRNPRVLKQLARASGGQAFFPEDMRQVRTICRNIAAEIRSRYVIGYVPQKVREGEYRSLKVKVRAVGRSGLRVRTRPGFRVPRKD